jgi:hypothetical protein
MWSIGCVFAELLQHKRLKFQETDLLDLRKNATFNWEEEYGDRYFQKYLNENDAKIRRYMSGKLFT